MEQPETEGTGKCRLLKSVNPLNLELHKEATQSSALIEQDMELASINENSGNLLVTDEEGKTFGRNGKDSLYSGTTGSGAFVSGSSGTSNSVGGSGSSSSVYRSSWSSNSYETSNQNRSSHWGKNHGKTGDSYNSVDSTGNKYYNNGFEEDSKRYR
jgi:hypothetical protein